VFTRDCNQTGGDIAAGDGIQVSFNSRNVRGRASCSLAATATHSIVTLKSRAGPSRDQRGPCNRACSSEVAIYNALFRLPQS